MHIRDQETRDQILDSYVRSVPLVLLVIEELVDSFYFEFGFVVGLDGGSSVDGAHDDVLQVAIDRTLVDRHEFFVKNVFTFAEDDFSLTSAVFLGLASAALGLRKLNHNSNVSLLFQLHQLFGQSVHSLAYN